MEYAIPLRETAKHTIRKSRESKRNNDPEMVQGIFEDVAMQNLDDTGNYIADGAGIDVKFNVNELPKWDGGITKEKGYEPTLRQFIQRIEDIGRMKGWGEQGGLLLLPNMLEGGIRFAFDRWRTTYDDDTEVWQHVVDWLETQDKATPTKTITSERLYSIKMTPKDTVESYTTRFYEVSAGYADGRDAVLKSIYMNGTKPTLKAYLVGKSCNSLDDVIAAARTWSAMQAIREGA